MRFQLAIHISLAPISLSSFQDGKYDSASIMYIPTFQTCILKMVNINPDSSGYLTSLFARTKKAIKMPSCPGMSNFSNEYCMQILLG